MKKQTKKTSILLVDDERMVLNVIAEQLISEGYAVQTASHFLDALFLLESQQFDVLVSDVGLQGYTGFDVLAVAQRAQPEIACILMSGFPNERDKKAAESFGALYLSKPLSASALRSSIESLPYAVAA